jgi:hypothetical protein
MPDDRCVMAAWIPIRGWGGALVLRELIQHRDGRLGARWLEEVVPATRAPVLLASRVDGSARFAIEHRAYLLSFVAEPRITGQGRLALTLMPTGEPAEPCELQVRLDTRRAQYGPGDGEGFVIDQKSLREGGAPHQACDYAVERLVGTERPFTVRVVVIRDDKIGGTLVDTEIAGQRTMISYRPDLTSDEILLRLEGVVLRQVEVAPLAG